MWVGVYHLIMRYGLKFSLLQTWKLFFIIDCSDFQDISCTLHTYINNGFHFLSATENELADKFDAGLLDARDR